jgi:hypothetical protein
MNGSSWSIVSVTLLVSLSLNGSLLAVETRDPVVPASAEGAFRVVPSGVAGAASTAVGVDTLRFGFVARAPGR